MENGKGRDWLKIGTLLLCAGLLGLNLWQGKRLSELEQDIWNAQNSVMDSVSRLDGRVGSLRSDFEKANDLVQDWSHSTAVNRERRDLDVEVAVTLKEWGEDTAVELLWSNVNGGHGSVPASGDGNGRFTGTFGLPVSELSGEYTLEAVIRGGGVQRREDLGWLGDFATLLPVQCKGWGSGGPEYTKETDTSGTIALSPCVVNLIGGRDAVSQTKEHTFRLWRNGEIAAEQAAKQDGETGRYVYDGEFPAEVQSGDKLLLTFFCRDESGLGYEFFLEGWSIEDGGIGTRTAHETDWPRLTWD